MPIEEILPKADPSVVPVEGPVEGRVARDSAESAGMTPAAGEAGNSSFGANDFGANNEALPERLQEALRRLVLQFSTESESTRRQEIRRIKQAHQFWRGLQYLWWDERDQNWHLPFEQKLADGSFARRSAALRVRHEYLSGVRAVAGVGAFAGRAARAIFSRRRRRRRKMWPRRRRRRKWRGWSSGIIASAI